MAAHAHEFQCNNCTFFNYPMLKDTLNGHYIVVCGNCQHKHYRTLKDGVVIQEGQRHSKTEDQVDTIYVQKSATSEKRRELGAIAKFRAMVTAGLAK